VKWECALILDMDTWVAFLKGSFISKEHTSSHSSMLASVVPVPSSTLGAFFVFYRQETSFMSKKRYTDDKTSNKYKS
jgi:hypothetical protein